MTTNVFLQLCSITWSVVIVLYIAYELGNKDRKLYSFWTVFIRKVRFNDNVPLDWLKKHKYYIAMYFLGISQIITISGLLRELGNGMVQTKTFEFFISAPLSEACILYLVHEFFKIKSPVYKQTLTSVSKAVSNFVKNYK